MLILFEDRLCVFCNNREVNAFEEKNVFWTSKACGHEICDSCRNRVFAQRQETVCPKCQEKFRKSNLSEKTKDEIDYDKEREVRATIAKDFNQSRDNFATEEEFNNYLEQVETLVHNKLFGTVEQIATADEEIKRNRKANAAKIAENEAKKAEKYRQFLEQKAETRTKLLDKQRQLMRSEAEARRKKEREKREQIEVLLGERAPVSSSAVVGADAGHAAGLAPQESKPQNMLQQAQAAASRRAAAFVGTAADQPKRLESKEKLHTDLSKQELTKRRRKAAGFTRVTIRRRTEEAMLSGLLAGLAKQESINAGHAADGSVKMECDPQVQIKVEPLPGVGHV